MKTRTSRKRVVQTAHGESADGRRRINLRERREDLSQNLDSRSINACGGSSLVSKALASLDAPAHLFCAHFNSSGIADAGKEVRRLRT
eukprot:1535046-Pleurochrysis_carterae.AAC.1